MLVPATVLALAALGSASPMPPEAQPPPISSSQGFILVANVTDLSKDLIPSVNHWSVTAVQIGAAQSTAVLANDTAGRVFFENGTDDNIGIAAADGGPYPWGLYVINYNPDPAKADYVEWFGLEIGLAQKGLGIRDGAGAIPQLFTPENGTFIICNETNPAYGRPQYPIKFAKVQVVDGVAHQDIPKLCAPVILLPQCAQLIPTSDGDEYSHDYVRTVRCYDNVAAIKW